MRAVFGVLSLLMVVAIVGMLVRKQLAPVAAPPPSADTASETIARPAGTPQQQVQQYQHAVQGAIQQQARPMPEEK
jgi:Na+-transporting methylmalonyl-CoA/oxaloacetate decarboxylase gamma subunit